MENRTKNLNIKISPTEQRRYKRLVEIEQRPISVIVRNLLNEYAFRIMYGKRSETLSGRLLEIFDSEKFLRLMDEDVSFFQDED